MFDRDWWELLTLICTGLLALSALSAKLYVKVVRPMWHRMRIAVRRINLAADDILGDPKKGIPSQAQRTQELSNQSKQMSERMDKMETRLSRIEATLAAPRDNGRIGRPASGRHPRKSS